LNRYKVTSEPYANGCQEPTSGDQETHYKHLRIIAMHVTIKENTYQKANHG
jgi:hypothetical protein